MTRTIKVVLISVGAVKGYSRSVWRAVECQVNQHGYKNERGVKVLFESEPLYRPGAGPRSKGWAAKQEAEAVAKKELEAALNL